MCKLFREYDCGFLTASLTFCFKSHAESHMMVFYFGVPFYRNNQVLPEKSILIPKHRALHSNMIHYCSTEDDNEIQFIRLKIC